MIPFIVVLVLAFAAIFVSGFVLFNAVSTITKPGYKAVEANAIGTCFDKGIALCLKDQRLVDLPQHESTRDDSPGDPLSHLPMYWWVHFALALVVLLGVAVKLTRNTRLTTIRLYFFSNNEPFPVVKGASSDKSSVFAIRLLHPHLLALTRQYLQASSRFAFLGHTEPLGTSETQRMAPRDQHRLTLQRDLGPIVRLALAFNLRRPISKRNEDAQTLSIEDNVSKSLRFSSKLHMPQLIGYIFLVAISILSIITRLFVDLSNTQYLLILAAFGFIWAYWSIQLHRREFMVLRKWDALNVHKPLESSPIYVLDYNHDYTPVWFELRDSDFETGIVEYGVDKQNLLNFLLSVLLMLFFVMLQLTK